MVTWTVSNTAWVYPKLEAMNDSLINPKMIVIATVIKVP